MQRIVIVTLSIISSSFTISTVKREGVIGLDKSGKEVQILRQK